ncbi:MULTISPECIES: ATP-binding protein [Cellulomonas]|uniref:ATP-binding protein n=1 Tax=Cellulomonas TaxID=1707 RepID=UPI0010A7E68A|nr:MULTISPECIES: ATP-binding protein [Cellulomonas]
MSRVGDRRAARDRALPAKRPPRGLRQLGRWQVDEVAELAGLRHAVRDAVAAHATPDRAARRTADQVTLLVSELATNALRHGGAPTVVELRTDGTTYLLDVADHDTASAPVMSGARAPGDGGFGLLIARRLAQDVGWYATRTTKHVWARIAAG